MSEMHLRQPGFKFSAGGPFTKNKERIQKFKETETHNKKELDKACFHQDMSHGGFKNLTRRTAFDKISCDKAFNFEKNPKYGCQRVFLQWFIKCLIKDYGWCC